ncbi:MAG: S-layer homology domain-containing protein [Clostridiales Family XIII bacterium]|jgi:hypothetical protein|nr:S-layer homology domain-containing protein [Clostridiales Family XIII bacterium]
MNRNRVKIAAVLVVAMLASALSMGFTRTDGIGNVYYSSDMEIFDGVRYSKILAGHDNNGVERAYAVTANLLNSPVRPLVFSGEAGDKYTLDTMVNTLEAQGYRVVAGINGDIFDTDTACPRSMCIHDGVIQTSGYDSQFVVSFDAAGRAELAWTNMNYGLSAEIFVPQPDGTYLQTPFNANIGFFNVPHGGAKALHLYNRTYGPGTKTTGDNVEVVLDAGSAEASQLRAGIPIRARVVEIRYNGNNTPIGDGQLVLSTASDSLTAESLKMMAAGMEVEIYASDMDGGTIAKSVECFGIYHLMYNNGSWVSEGTNVNPRTMLGIKRDGSVMLYELDGRQQGISGGLGLSDATRHMVALGAAVVVNLDGGGSSTMVVREPGIDAKAVMKNSPSDGAQRRVANGLFFVYRDLPAAGGNRISLYQNHYLAMPGADVQLTPYLTNSLFEGRGAAASGVQYEVTGGDGSVNGSGVFTAGERQGRATVRATLGGAETTAVIDVYTGVTLTPSQSSVFADPGQILDLNMSAVYGYAPISHKDSLFLWECDEKVGSIDENGVFAAVDRTGVSGEIRVSYNGTAVIIPVQVGAKVTFLDLTDPATGLDHWAKAPIEELASQGIVNGMGDDMFGPDSPLTRAQFLAMLAKSVVGLDLNASPAAGFEDVPMEEWYYRYVNWGYGIGVAKGMDETRFAPDAQITREQMTVMLHNFASAYGIPLPAAEEAPLFTDAELISDWAAYAVNAVVQAGLMNGMSEGNFGPQGSATRAQAAKVAYLLCLIRDNPAAPPAVPELPPDGAELPQTPSDNTELPPDNAEATPGAGQTDVY